MGRDYTEEGVEIDQVSIRRLRGMQTMGHSHRGLDNTTVWNVDSKGCLTDIRQTRERWVYLDDHG